MTSAEALDLARKALGLSPDDDAIDTARKLMDLTLDLIPHEVARQLLSDAAIRRANLIADAAEVVKFDFPKPPSGDDGP